MKGKQKVYVAIRIYLPLLFTLHDGKGSSKCRECSGYAMPPRVIYYFTSPFELSAAASKLESWEGVYVMYLLTVIQLSAACTFHYYFFFLSWQKKKKLTKLHLLILRGGS